MEPAETRLWRDAWPSDDTQNNGARTRARFMEAYRRTREHAGLLAAEISRDMPRLTVHDGSHLDALWELASDIAGESVTLTPPETFVFGCSVLIHDLGLGVAAYPGGLQPLKEETEWRAVLASVLRAQLMRTPTAAEVDGASPDVEEVALEAFLRRRHARTASELGNASWDVSDGQLYLIEDRMLREAYGSTIGEIAASHWEDADFLAATLDRTLNPLPGDPASWTVDIVKLACLLRAADAIHLDQRRAPALLRAVRRPSDDADLHWAFQERVLQPVIDVDRVRFTTGKPFARKDSRAWWTGFDLIRSADLELRRVDTLLADLGRERFQARGVVGADDPRRLAHFVRTDGWTPIDAAVKVGDVATLVQRLGGTALYGRDQIVPLRELLQNASDAIRARRTLEQRSDDWGTVTVSFDGTPTGKISVRDTGVGMSVPTMTDTLLDFGKSLWSSPDLIDVFPTLAATGYEPTGQFGIGFFSVLMWGDHVTVVSQPMAAGVERTSVLELSDGVSSRPLLRPASEDELLVDGGTEVTVQLDTTALDKWERHAGWEALAGRSPHHTRAQALAWVAPTAPVNLDVSADGETRPVIGANDWTTIPADELLARCDPDLPRASARYGTARQGTRADRLRVACRPDGTPVARISLSPGSSAVVTVGGFRAGSIANLAGALIGGDPNLARDASQPIIDGEVFRSWFAEQARLLEAEEAAAWHVGVAATMLKFDLPVGGLPVCRSGSGEPLNLAELAQRARGAQEFALIGSLDLEEWLSDHGFADHRIDDIEVGGSFYQVSSPPFDFTGDGIYATPSPAGKRTLEDEIADMLSATWGSDVRVEETLITVGWFDASEEVECTAIVFAPRESEADG